MERDGARTASVTLHMTEWTLDKQLDRGGGAGGGGHIVGRRGRFGGESRQGRWIEEKRKEIKNQGMQGGTSGRREFEEREDDEEVNRRKQCSEGNWLGG